MAQECRKLFLFMFQNSCGVIMLLAASTVLRCDRIRNTSTVRITTQGIRQNLHKPL
uniref:Uncharacterized protein n=1 Tax=Arundo donax TaxID=35708 RepID=A0A0A9B8Z7_ARUDO